MFETRNIQFSSFKTLGNQMAQFGVFGLWAPTVVQQSAKFLPELIIELGFQLVADETKFDPTRLASNVGVAISTFCDVTIRSDYWRNDTHPCNSSTLNVNENLNVKYVYSWNLFDWSSLILFHILTSFYPNQIKQILPCVVLMILGPIISKLHHINK